MPDVETIITAIDAWAARSFRDSPITRDTAAWNHFHDAVARLKAELRAMAPPPDKETE